jgi:hypothetical protein
MLMHNMHSARVHWDQACMVFSFLRVLVVCHNVLLLGGVCGILTHTTRKGVCFIWTVEYQIQLCEGIR